mmetsp:Transcript_59629/g.134517  ORF Transcript_59629/g.134517 Transcript_59629/m.134517 type:complete len:212 (+) Transcript_59629:1411-2046(+)
MGHGGSGDGCVGHGGGDNGGSGRGGGVGRGGAGRGGGVGHCGAGRRNGSIHGGVGQGGGRRYGAGRRHGGSGRHCGCGAHCIRDACARGIGDISCHIGRLVGPRPCSGDEKPRNGTHCSGEAAETLASLLRQTMSHMSMRALRTKGFDLPLLRCRWPPLDALRGGTLGGRTMSPQAAARSKGRTLWNTRPAVCLRTRLRRAERRRPLLAAA